MSTFHIVQDVENNVKNLKGRNLIVTKNVLEKKFKENRGILQSISNGVGRDAKKRKLNHEKDEDILDLIPIQTFKLDDTVLKVKKNEQVLKEEDHGSSLALVEYQEDIWQYLKQMETVYHYPKSKYMLKQPHLSWSSRSIVVDWLAGVAYSYNLSNETLHLSVNYIDRFLNQMAVMKKKFQLLGAAAMSLAGKMEEIYPIDMKEWAYLTGDAFSSRQIVKMEYLLAKILNFKMQPPTVCGFIDQFCEEHKLDSKTKHLAMYISELILLEGDEYLNQIPSKLGAACILFARYTLSMEHPWPKKFQQKCGYTLKQLSPVVQRQQQTFIDSPRKEQQEIQNKYKSDKFQKVALMKPRVLDLHDLEILEDDE